MLHLSGSACLAPRIRLLDARCHARRQLFDLSSTAPAPGHDLGYMFILNVDAFETVVALAALTACCSFAVLLPVAA